MNKFFACSLQPLQKRIKNELPPESTSLLKAVSIVWPVLIYNVVSELIIIVFAYFMQWISLQEGSLQQMADWLRLHSTLVSGAVKGLSLAAGAGAVYQMFVKENPVYPMPPSYKKDVGMLFILGASAALSINILFALLQFTGSSESYEQVAGQQFSFPLLAGIVLYGIISPIAEEIVFRGLVYNRLRRQYSREIALIGSAVLFGLYHGNIVQAFYGFILGLLIAVMYEKYGSFLVPVILHGAANICVYVVTSDAGLQNLCMNWAVFLVSILLSVVLLIKCLVRTNKE